MTSRAGAGEYGGFTGRRSRRWGVAEVPALPVTTAREAAELDARTIAAGVPSRALMQRAGAAATGEICRLLVGRARPGATIYVGPGNNGGDGWVVARSLAAAGIPVTVVTAGDTRTDDSRAERALAEAEPLVTVLSLDEHAREPAGFESALVVDALLGTGAKGAPREPVASAIARIARASENGATVVALDIPSGIDADSGGSDCAVRADLTLTFGTIKRGILIARGSVGRIVVLDIGFAREGDESAQSDARHEAGREAPLEGRPLGRADARRHAPRTPSLVDERWLRSVIPPFAADAHKGTRRKLVIVGGQLGMAGAPVLAARAAMRSGIGMVRLVVSPESLPIVQECEPHALARAWPEGDASSWSDVVDGWADVVLAGPGLGASASTRAMVEYLLESWRGPVVLDADALNVFAGDAAALGRLLAGRPALLTPHVAEFARLSGLGVDEVLANRIDVGAEVAHITGAAVLLKGVPTVVTSPDGERLVSAAGTPALAAAGSGDLLGGIAATLLAQLADPLRAGAAAAWVHGRAAEIAGSGTSPGAGARRPRGGPARCEVRGITLADIEDAIGRVWSEDAPLPVYPVLAELPAAGTA
jgi:NAD(P)H-hydrate epimerase